MTNSKTTTWYDLTSIEIPVDTQDKMFKDPKVRKSVQKVFAAIWGLQDDIDKALWDKKQD